MESIAVYYLSLLTDIRKAARECGYAIGIHGSMSRDFDLIAAPWTAEATDAVTLVEAVRKAVNGSIIEDGTPGGRWDKEAGEFVAAVVRNPAEKPHCRLAWSIQLGAGSYIDLSVMPVLRKKRPGADVAFLMRLPGERGAIVSSADCSELEIAEARASRRFFVDADSMGYVLRPKEWLQAVTQKGL